METVFFGQCYFAASRNHYWNKEKTVLREKAHSCKWKTDFPASANYFFSPFYGVPCQFFSVSWKSTFQGNSYFWLLETDFRSNSDFHKQKKSCK